MRVDSSITEPICPVVASVPPPADLYRTDCTSM